MIDLNAPDIQGESYKPFRVLSLDSGGIRGAFSTAVLEVMEQRLEPLAGHFDLNAGTSTSGIIAAGITAGEPPSRIVEFFRNQGSQIFTRPIRKKVVDWRFFRFYTNWKLKLAGIKKIELDGEVNHYANLRDINWEHSEREMNMDWEIGRRLVWYM